MTRLHPIDVVSAGLPDRWFAEIQEAVAQGRDVGDRRVFHDLEPVRRLLGQVALAEGEAAGTTVAGYEALLYAACRFWSTGRHSLVLERATVERMLAADREPPTDPGAPPPGVPHGACYLQLPERLFWARISDAAAPEPLDGVFLAADPTGGDLTVLAVLGLRAERAGFSQVVLTASVDDLAASGALVRRPLFAPVLDGGERAGVKSLVSEAELLHLVCLALAQVAG